MKPAVVLRTTVPYVVKNFHGMCALPKSYKRTVCSNLLLFMICLKIINSSAEWHEDVDTALPVYSGTDSGCVMLTELPRRSCKSPFHTGHHSLDWLRRCLL